MNDFETERRPEPDEPDVVTPTRQAAIELLGEDAVISLESQEDTLELVDNLTRVENPFKLKRPNELDLTFLKPEEAEKLAGPRARGWSKAEIQAMSPAPGGSSTLAGKLLKNGKQQHHELANKSREVDARLTQTDGSMDVAFVDNFAVSSDPDFDKIRSFLDYMAETAKILPSPATTQTLNSMYAAAKNIYLWRNEILGPISRAADRRVVKINLKNIEGCVAATEILDKHLSKARNQGTASHERLIGIARNGQTQTAIRLLDTIGDAKRLIPPLEGLTEEQVAAAMDAESYLADRVGVVESTLKSSAPTFLNRPEVQSMIRKLRARDTASAMETKRSRELQLRELGLVEELGVQVSEARDVLRGGQRLGSTKRKPADPVRRKADALHDLKDSKNRRLLEPEESGVIVAIVTGKFGNFAGIISRISAADRDEALEIIKRSRPEAVQALEAFNLKGASARINSLVRDPASGPKFIGILTADEISEIQKTLDGVLDTDSREEYLRG